MSKDIQQRGLEHLEESLKLLKETEQIGNDTLNRLESQREQSLKIKENIKNVNTELTQSNTFASRILKKLF